MTADNKLYIDIETIMYQDFKSKFYFKTDRRRKFPYQIYYFQGADWVSYVKNQEKMHEWLKSTLDENDYRIEGQCRSFRSEQHRTMFLLRFSNDI